MSDNNVAPIKKIEDIAAEAAKTPSAPTVSPSPLPTVFNLGQAEVKGGERMVVLQVMTPVGQAVYFLDGASAESLGTTLIRMGGITKSGLVMP